VTLLRARAQLHPRQPLFTFLGRRLDELRTMTFGALDTRARAVAAQLRPVTAPGACVAVVCPKDMHFVEAFMGCQCGRDSGPARVAVSCDGGLRRVLGRSRLRRW
jgi:acyl-CoA synthetase (AMP-forming)/AMP-acid ligase II